MPHPIFLEVPPPRGFRILYANGWGVIVPGVPAETVETERGRGHACFAKKA